MSHVEEEGTPQEQVDYVPDSKKDGSGDTEPEPKITCKKCIHKDVCYFLTRLCDEDAQMKQSGITRLPFSPYMLAVHCKMYVTKNGETSDPKKESGQ